jgi:hypothetical protein
VRVSVAAAGWACALCPAPPAVSTAAVIVPPTSSAVVSMRSRARASERGKSGWVTPKAASSTAQATSAAPTA